jgi:Domain of unknown function (DUF4145)
VVDTFIVDCPKCRAKVAAEESGRAQFSEWDEDVGEPSGELVQVGQCPRCRIILVARSVQLDFKGYEDSPEDQWSAAERVYPKPAKTFFSRRISRTLTISLLEADRCLQANANMAACTMFGRALEALCRDHLEDRSNPDQQRRPVMLGAGLRQLRDKNIIDARLFDWSQHLQAFRNLAAHPDDTFEPTRHDAEDLQAFVYAIVEYVYDLTDRYNQFKDRQNRKASAQRQPLGPVQPTKTPDGSPPGVPATLNSDSSQ